MVSSVAPDPPHRGRRSRVVRRRSDRSGRCRMGRSCVSPTHSVIDDLRKPSCPVPSASRLRPRLVSARDSVPRSPYPSERPTRTRLEPRRRPLTREQHSCRSDAPGPLRPRLGNVAVRRRLRRRGRTVRSRGLSGRTARSASRPSAASRAESRSRCGCAVPIRYTMARMHTRRRGSSGSDKPATDENPEWSDVDAEDIESRVVELAEQGRPQRHRTQAP